MAKKPVRKNMGGVMGRPAMPTQASAGMARAAGAATRPAAAGAGMARTPFKKGGRSKKGC